MALDLFAGIPVSDFARGLEWWERLLGTAPAFFPHDTEAVWELDEHRFVYVVLEPENAGHARLTVFAGDFDDRVTRMSARGVAPAQMETYGNGVRKATYRDPDGNEIGFGGAPV